MLVSIVAKNVKKKFSLHFQAYKFSHLYLFFSSESENVHIFPSMLRSTYFSNIMTSLVPVLKLH